MTAPPVIGPGLRETLSTYLPTWLGNVPGFRNLYAILWTAALLGDCLREVAWEGQLAAYPGVGTRTALPLIGASRALIQGPTEPDDVFAVRAIAWRDNAEAMGSSTGIAKNVQAFLNGQGSLGPGVLPVVRVIDRNGDTTTANADGTITYGSVTWTWDDLGGWVDGGAYREPSEVVGYWSDQWIVIEDPYTHYTSTSDPAWLAAWNSGDQTFDSLTPQAVVNGIMSILRTWKGAHEYERCVVWAPDPTTFAPTGYYGNASRNVSGLQTPSRDPALSYWQPASGDGG